MKILILQTLNNSLGGGSYSIIKFFEYLSTKGHTVYLYGMNKNHLFFRKNTFFKNFNLIPLGGAEFSPETGITIIRGGAMAFEIALRFAAPAMVFLLLVDVAIALTARVMPQMNIFLVTLPLKIGAGLFVMIFSLDIFQILFDPVYDDLAEIIGTLVTNMGA